MGILVGIKGFPFPKKSISWLAAIIPQANREAPNHNGEHLETMLRITSLSTFESKNDGSIDLPVGEDAPFRLTNRLWRDSIGKVLGQATRQD